MMMPHIRKYEGVWHAYRSKADQRPVMRAPTFETLCLYMILYPHILKRGSIWGERGGER